MTHKQAAWQHFGRAEWAAARDAFAAALEAAPGDPEALDGLGQSLWWLGERAAGIEHRRDAYAAYRRDGDARGAGHVAVYLAGEHRIDGQDAAAAGWLARARRLLADEPTGPEHGWLAIEEAKRAADPAAAERHARAALAIAHELADPDVECMALAQLGSALVRAGRVDEGIALLDEAMTVALGGESRDPLACGDACCTTLVVCDRLADLRRATEWCAAVVEFTERRRFTPVQSWCRGDLRRRPGARGRLGARGGGARRGAAQPDRPQRNRVLPLAVLAELRLRQGRSEEAEHLLAGLDGPPRRARPARRTCTSSAATRRSRSRTSTATAPTAETPAMLVLRGAAALAAGDLAAAAGAAERLRELARRSRARTSRPRRRCSRAAPPPAVTRGAARALEEAVAASPRSRCRSRRPARGSRWPRVEAALGSPLAVPSARAARDAFERLGARRDADRAAALLRELGASGRSAVRTASATSSPPASARSSASSPPASRTPRSPSGS